MSQRQGRTPRSAACRPAGRHVQNLRWLGLLACLAMASPAVAQPAGNAVGALQGGRKIAVVIGINQYDDKRIPGLNFCVNDSVQMYETLVNECGYRPDDVLLLNDNGGLAQAIGDALRFIPTRKNLIDRMQFQFRLAQPEDTVLVFFSGHGFLENGKGVLATRDCQLNQLESTGLTTQELNKLLENCLAQRKLLVLDCCHAGAVRGGTAEKILLSEMKLQFDRAKGLVTLASCSPEEKSVEWHEKKLGLFTFFLTEGLRGKADTIAPFGIVDHEELFRYTRHEVIVHADRAFRAQQTPTIYYGDGARGLFPLATVPVDPKRIETPANPDPTTDGPPPPGQIAEEAFARLTMQRSREPLEDAKVLVAEAKGLRTPVLKSPGAAGAISTRNPYFNAERAKLAYDWLQVARTHMQATDPEALRSLQISLALASWYMPDSDRKTARNVVEQLYPFEAAKEPSNVKAHLLLIHAGTRDTTPQGAREALASYASIIELERRHAVELGEEMPPLEMSDNVLRPALKAAASLPAPLDAESRALLIKVHGTFGRLAERNLQLFSEDQAEVVKGLEFALQNDPQDPALRRTLASILMQQFEPDLPRVRGLAEEALKLSSDPFNQLVAQRLIGDALLKESRDLRRLPELKAMIGEANGAYQQAVAQFPNLKNAPPVVQNQARLHYVDALLGLAGAHLYQANFLKAYQDHAQMMVSLNEAIKYAKQATDLDDDRIKYQACITMGNVLEDRAWLCGVQSDWKVAEQWFEAAKKHSPYDAQCYLNLARCKYKREVFGKEGRFIEDAIPLLNHVIHNLHEDDAKGEAHYFMAKIHIERNNVAAADEEFKKAWDAMQGPDTNDYTRAACLESWANMALSQADTLLAEASLAPEATKKVREFLGTADYRSGDLEYLDKAKATLIKARALLGEARLLDKQREDSLPKLQAARALYDQALAGQDISDEERSNLLFNRAYLLVSTRLWETDQKQASPQAIADAQASSKLAPHAHEQATALALAGSAALSAADFHGKSGDSAKMKAFRAEAARLLEQAIGLWPAKNGYVWEWKKHWGIALYYNAFEHPLGRNRIEALKQAKKAFDEAGAECPASKADERSIIRGLSATVERQIQEQSRRAGL
jgi:uncharacterized caspase-like protein/tetratricopeptide (TPR) repeat protein